MHEASRASRYEANVAWLQTHSPFSTEGEGLINWNLAGYSVHMQQLSLQYTHSKKCLGKRCIMLLANAVHERVIPTGFRNVNFKSN